MSADEMPASVEVAVRDVLALADKLSPYVTLNCPDDSKLEGPKLT